MSRNVDYNRYLEFVGSLTSKESGEFGALLARLIDLSPQVKIEQLLTGGVGINAEAGELLEIIKKVIFQGKEWNEETRFHVLRELGDIQWYIGQVCLALGVTLDEVVELNVEKLQKRYPGGSFDVHYSENRQEGDI